MNDITRTPVQDNASARPAERTAPRTAGQASSQATDRKSVV